MKKKICIILQSPHQVDMKNVVKCWKDFFGYFNALETHSKTHLVPVFERNSEKENKFITYNFYLYI